MKHQNIDLAEEQLRPFADVNEWLTAKRNIIALRQETYSIVLDEPPFSLARRLARSKPNDERARQAHEGIHRKLEHHQAAYQARLVLTQQSGTQLPIRHLAAKHRLDEIEQEILETVLAIVTDPTSEGNHLTTGRLSLLLADGNEERARYYLRRLVLSESNRLTKANLIEANNFPPGTMPAKYRISIPRKALHELLGVKAQPDTPETETESKPKPHVTGDIAEFLAEAGVILATETLRTIQAIWGSIAHWDTITKEWGFGNKERLSSCLGLLFHGPPGTGKTLTAHQMSKALNRKTVVVSYADLLNCFVGETEKSIRRYFRKASKENAVLLFDEADAILGCRGSIARAVDRHFNAEVNTMLMELEQFKGICVLTTNHAELLDTALERRIRYKVYFAPPEATARARIWRCHIPKETPLAEDVDLDRLADKFKMTGGQIANAVQVAAAMAAARIDGSGQDVRITIADLEAAARRESEGYSSGKPKRDRVGF